MDEDKYFYVNIDIHTNDYEYFGTPQKWNIEEEAIDEFTRYIQNDSAFKHNRRLIYANFSYISYIYLSLNNRSSLYLKTPKDKQLYVGNSKWLRRWYPFIYDALIKNNSVIVTYAMISHQNTNKEAYDTVDIIESRIKRNGLASLLLSEYELRTLKKVLPSSIVNGAENFWASFLCVGAYSNITDIFKNGFKKEYVQRILHQCKHLLSLFPHTRDESISNLSNFSEYSKMADTSDDTD